MLQIKCPWCGLRAQREFACKGEAHIVRPKNPEKLSDQEWGDYVFFRKNPKGIHYERWIHRYGCRRWFNAVRNTISDEFIAFYKIGETPPKIEKPTVKKNSGKVKK